MAILKYYNSIILVTMIIAIYLFSHLISFCYASQIKSLTHHTLDLSQHGQLSRCINPSSTTNPASGKDNATAVFEIFHKRSLCGDAADGATSSYSSAEKILRRDQLRVKHLMSHKIVNNKHVGRTDDDHSAPVQSGDSLDVGNYVVRMGLGTPTRYLHLVLDTGSFLTWTQCRPCLTNCYKQRDRTFDPSKSTSYSNISCTDLSECPHPDFGCYENRTCVYVVPYADHSYTFGFMAKEKLTVTKNDVFPNFMFGCGQNNSGTFGKAAGLVGLGRGRLSVVSQTEQKFGGYFSYFLPTENSSSPGHLTFGKNINNRVKFTSLIYRGEYPYYYFINITSITVGCKRLSIPPSVFENDENVIDSGTLITYLPHKAYVAMSEEFKRQMNATRYPIEPPVDVLDTCFRVPKSKKIEHPTITFSFEGQVTVDVDPYGIFYVVNPRLVCLAFAGHEEDGFSVFGNMAQQNMEVVYDVAGGKLGFGVPAI